MAGWQPRMEAASSDTLDGFLQKFVEYLNKIQLDTLSFIEVFEGRTLGWSGCGAAEYHEATWAPTVTDDGEPGWFVQRAGDKARVALLTPTGPVGAWQFRRVG